METGTAALRAGLLRFAARLGLALGLCVLTLRPAWADVIADWGTVVTPLSSDVSFSFARYDVTNNFADQYLFSLEGSSNAYYSVTFNVDPCARGCGNPSISYGIYDANGGLIQAAADGNVILSSGKYAFEVSATGMGAGNSVDYAGSVTISAGMVSPAPEPATNALLLLGLAAIAWSARSGTRARRVRSNLAADPA